MEAHELAESLLRYEQVDLNEADTRHQVIDQILHDVLGWPRALTKCEQHIQKGYSDYVLYNRASDPVLVIEAKRAGEYFHLPLDSNTPRLSRSFSLSTLLTDPATKKAVEQARSYAVDLGCEYAAVTNGHQWIFFRAFAKGKNWRKLPTFVIQSLRWFSSEFISATNILSYTAIDQKHSLQQLIGPGQIISREIYYPKERISSFDRPVTTNRFSKYLRPIASRYFMNLEDAEEEFFDECYVQRREYTEAFAGLSAIIKDSLTPYLEEYGVQQTVDTDRGGKIGNRIIRSLRDAKSADVVVLFGGKGIGKSTFLRRLLVHSPPQFLSKRAVVVRIDLLNTPDEPGSIQTHIWKSLVNELDVERILDSERNVLISLFSDRFEVAERQSLFALPKDSVEYNISLNALVDQWKTDHEYCATRLAEYWKTNHRGVVVVIDNTDQLSGINQDLCFTLAQQIAKHLECLSLISMREERFQRSRVHGVLDAFQNAGYHLSAPLPDQVFLSRIRYVKRVLVSENVSDRVPSINVESEERGELSQFFNIVENEFRKGEESPLYTFLVACAHGNIRLALELFRGFLVSGYTNIDEMVGVKGIWTLKIHQVVRPLMTPHRFFYEESDSQIPNLFQVRSKANGSHFTALRLLRRIARGADPRNPHFVSVQDLRDVFESGYGMGEDLDANLDMLLRYVLIESNNRLDEYSPEVDEVRVTQYGLYIMNEIVHDFTYLDLTSTDCGYFSETACNDVAYYGNADYKLFRDNKKLERVNTRIEKVRRFLEYFQEQENWEAERLHIVDEDLVAKPISEAFEARVPDIERSAARSAKR